MIKFYLEILFLEPKASASHLQHVESVSDDPEPSSWFNPPAEYLKVPDEAHAKEESEVEADHVFFL